MIGGDRRMQGLDEVRAFAWSETAGTAAAANALFSASTRPVIRWIKGNGLDDVITRSAVAQATRLFGDRVDYCLCTSGIDAPRVRDILAWASEPVHWWPLGGADNPELAALLMATGATPQSFGYWWKWFPERVRPNGPEWVLDGDMILTAAPPWFDVWAAGKDELRVTSADEYWPLNRDFYGDYAGAVDPVKLFYSGLISLPPGRRYMPAVVEVLLRQPLRVGHDGRRDMSEQGVIAAAFSRLDATPIPLAEFPFARAFEETLDRGVVANNGVTPWGYHFGNAFRRENHHFVRMVDAGEVFWRDGEPLATERYCWLRNRGQWGRPGLSINRICAERVAALASRHACRPALELGTSRGYLAAIMADHGAILTTVDREDRGASLNLAGLNVCSVFAEAAAYLRQVNLRYALIAIDLHGNDPETWRVLWPLVQAKIAPGGTIVLCNSHLWMIPEWRGESGLKWLLEETPDGFDKQIFETPAPGMVILTAAGAPESSIAPPAPRRAPVAAKEKQPRRAVAAAQAAVAEWPEDARLYDALCIAHEALNNDEAALEAARRAAALAPHRPGYRERLVRHLLHQGYIAEAENEVRALLAMTPNHAGAHHAWSTILLRLDRAEEALDAARTAARLEPDRPGLQHHAGALAMRRGFLDEAETAARRAIALAPHHGDHRLLLSRILERRGDIAAAIAAAQHAVAQDPNSGAASQWLAQLERRAAGRTVA